LHLSTEFHVYNTKRRIAELAPVTEDVFDEKKAQMVSANQSAMTEVTFKCHPCNKTFKSIEMLDQHKKSKNHKKNEKAYVAANPNVSESSMFKSISHADKSETISANENILDGIDQESEQKSEPLKVKESCKTTLDSLRICLFCNKESDGVKKNIDHMRIKHSFTILDVDCLVDLKGMLTYMASRI
jgi:pre-60S factor REI1